jgi:radical SAM superfamily enzyme YgiQ (UPF0313 family)
MLKAAGCNLICYGIEAGNDELRNKVLVKKVDRDKIITAFRKTKERGIKTLAFNMVGLPGETPEMIEETIALNLEVKTDVPFVSVFRPYPGTPLYDLCEKNGWISNRRVESYFQNSSILDQPSISRKQIAYYHNVFPWKVMFPKLTPLISPFMKIIYDDHISIYNVFIMPIVKWLFKFKSVK